MSRSRRAAGSVRGPASALTSFLAGLGVEPSAPLTTWGNSPSIPTGESGAVQDGSTAEIDSEAPIAEPEAGPSTVTSGKREADVEPNSTRKRARQLSIDSDDLDEPGLPENGEPSEDSPEDVAAEPLKGNGEFMTCGECKNRFTVTSYTKEHPKLSLRWLCVKCCYALGIDPFEKAKKPKAQSTNRKDNRAKIVHYEQKKGVISLSETCIQLIGSYIEDVEQLGDIGSVNMDKVCKIISKNRRLTPETAALFYSTEREDLALYDCTRLVHESYMALPRLCPNLEHLSLNLCGRLTTEAVSSWGKTFKHLSYLELNGPFLVRSEAWQDFLKARKTHLTSFLITQSPRIDVAVVTTLAQSCPNIVDLRLCEIGQFSADFVPLLASLKKLESLDLSSPGTSLSDDELETLLKAIGKNLSHLDLSDHNALSDVALTSIQKFCPKLRELKAKNIPELTDEGVANFFSLLTKSKRPGLRTVDLEKGHDLGDKALEMLIKHSAQTIEKLNIGAWKEVSGPALSQLARCTGLQEVNLGWCRQVGDKVIGDILKACEDIRVVKVWGCNHLTDKVPRKKGVKVIGIETHSI